MGRSVGIAFFGLFAAAGIFLGGLTIRTLWQWFGSLDWQPVAATAELLQVDVSHDEDGSSYRLRLELPKLISSPIHMEARWAIPPNDSSQVGAVDRVGEVVEIDKQMESEATRSVKFLPPPFPPGFTVSTDKNAKQVIKLEITGRLGDRGYSDTFKFNHESLRAYA